MYPKKLHIVILREFLPLFFAALIITLFVFILQFIWLYADDLIGKDLNFSVFFELLFYLALMNLIMVIPISIMLASIMTFGNMGEHFEITAAKASGISLFKLMKPMFYFSILASSFLIVVADNIFPYSTYQAYTLVTSIRQQHPAMRFQEGIFNYDIDDYVIRVGKKGKTSNIMYDILIYDHKNFDGDKFVIAADSGTIVVTEELDYLVINLYGGSQYEEINENNVRTADKKYPYHIDYFKHQEILIPLTNFKFKKSDLSFIKQQYNMLRIKQLSEKIDSLKIIYETKNEYFTGIFLNADLLRQKTKLKTSLDSTNYLEKLEVLNNTEPSKLKIIYNLDSAFNSKSLIAQKNIVRTAQTYAEDFLNRISIYSQEAISRREWLTMHQVAYYRKFVYAIASLIFFFIGAPLGSIIRKGGFGMPVIISVIFVMIFYVIITLGEKMAKSGTMSAFNGSWLVIYIFLPITVYVFYKAATDSVIMSSKERAKNFIAFLKNILRIFKIKQQKKKKTKSIS